MLLASRELDRLAASLVRQCDRAKTRVFPGTEAKSGERRTVCWRELDSKFQFRATVGGLAGLRDTRSGQSHGVASEFVSTRWENLDSTSG